MGDKLEPKSVGADYRGRGLAGRPRLLVVSFDALTRQPYSRVADDALRLIPVGVLTCRDRGPLSAVL